MIFSVHSEANRWNFHAIMLSLSETINNKVPLYGTETGHYTDFHLLTLNSPITDSLKKK